MTEAPEYLEPAEDPDIPEWDDQYLSRVSDRLMFNYDLEKDYTVRGERFGLYGQMRMSSEKHFFHPAIRFAYHESTEHLFAKRVTPLTVRDLERFSELGHDLADDWIEPDEQHFSTEFTFVAITESISDPVREFTASYRDRNLIKLGFYGHYEIHLIVVAPDDDDIVASEEAGVEEAFRLWDPIEREEPGLFQLITRRLQL